jgi:succinate dehydrogenase/fumarate reductase flavoprotein subunit
MGYTPELKELIKKVEATRKERVARAKRGEMFPPLSLDEREEVLTKFHPDYKKDGKQEVTVGPNTGDVYPEEFVDILQAYSVIDPDTNLEELVERETDVLILGGGGAGSSAALLAREQGCKVVVATKLRHGDSNTVMAEGGIQAATRRADSPYYHFLDVLGGGHFTNDKELVSALVHDAPVVIEWLEKLGMMFTKNKEGDLDTVHGGGTCRRRMHSAGDMTGSEIMRVLRDEIRNWPEDIEIIEFAPAVELVRGDNGKIAGAVLYNMETEEFFVIKAKAVVIATGGYGRLHIQGFATTNHYGACADGLVLGYRAGVPLRFMHSTQYHPTGTAYPEQNIGLLITEKVRGFGANLLNCNGEQFVFEREPRDVESSCIIRECIERELGIMTPTGRVGVWLDSPMIDMLWGEGTVEKEFPAKFIQFKRYEIDISKEPLLVFPTLHYQNGGLEINDDTETKIPGLFVAGESSGGVHGENRLMGNSLLDITVFGRRAGTNAAAYAKEKSSQSSSLSLEHTKAYNKALEEQGVERVKKSPILLPDYTREEVAKKQLNRT